jgi:ubiquinone/menaquinone biosynthesis C-methylase UbiE
VLKYAVNQSVERIFMKPLPKNPTLELLSKEVNALCAMHQNGDPACCQRIRQHHTSFKTNTDKEILSHEFTINHAQQIVAGEYGYTSWAAVIQYIKLLSSTAYNCVADIKGYHQNIVDSYDERSKVYDKGQWHRDLARQTVDYYPPGTGDSVLDIATGTGTIAFYAAELVGPKGSVTGIDLSKGMLEKCNEKLSESGLKNLRFVYADAEDLDFQANSLDRIYCSSAFFWMSHPLAALRHWFELLKPNGQLGFNAWPDNSFVWGDGARRALRKYGVNFICHEATGNVEKTQQLVELAGFSNVRIHEVKDGRYVKPEDLKGPPLNNNGYSPGQYPHPLANVSDEILALAQKDYEAEIDKHTTDKGVWHDMTMYYVYGQKL